ncbi:MAG: ABC transporter ATP-binding protein [Thermodesulfobacteriota bacterium]
MSVPPLVSLHDISKSFGPVKANANITLDIRAGFIKALLGENGAGKSTLMSILAGRFQPDAGTIRIQGVQRLFASTAEALESGIGMVYQHFMLVEPMTVAENVFLGQKNRTWLTPAHMEARVRQLADQYGLEVDPGAKVHSLSMGEKQRVEILKLLFRDNNVLILDEPTTVLTPNEVEHLFQAMRTIAAQGKAVVFISHKLAEVMDVADEIAILRQGTITDELPAREVHSQAELARRMVGREVILSLDRAHVALGRPVLQINDLQVGPVQEVSFSLHRGEIVAVVGVAGNGQRPLVESICGLRSPESGEVTILGLSWSEFYSRFEWQGALSYIPEDRLGLATCPALDLVDNFLLTTRQGFCRGSLLDRSKAERATQEMAEKFNVHPSTPHTRARQLSGGNLQKMVLARELYRRPRLIVAEQPSQGLDISATEEVWQHLLRARERAGVLLITGDLNEAANLADRIAVLYQGRFMDIFPTADRTKMDNIGPLMAGMAP